MTDRQNLKESTGLGARVLIPVDFSKRCDLSLRIGFEVARRLNLGVTVLNASILPAPGLFPQFPDDFDGMDNENFELQEMEVGSVIRMDADKRMHKLSDSLRQKQKSGELPHVNMDTEVIEGLPEEVIVEYCALREPKLVVMATRGKNRRDEELIGSVTAEVIDNVRVPIFTVPEDYSFVQIEDIVRLCAFCYLDGNDFNSIKALMGMFENPAIKVWLYPVVDKMKPSDVDSKISQLLASLRETYPNSEFELFKPDEKDPRVSVEELFERLKIQMILTPNKKRNFFARLFKPGLAHRILYEKDIPMLVMPV